MDQNLIVILAIAAVALVVLLGVAVAMRRRKSHRLHETFGGEYERAVADRGRTRAEKELVERQRRFERAHLRDLSVEDRNRYSESWQSIQTRFVDAPAAAVAEADHLVNEVMRMRGYPSGDFDQRLADVAIGHPDLVDHYRSAWHVAERSRTGRADTEELRQALVHYRALFEELLAPAPTTEPSGARARYRTRTA